MDKGIEGFARCRRTMGDRNVNDKNWLAIQEALFCKTMEGAL
jgi:hypothetical protein